MAILEDTIGAILIGALVSALLSGAVTTQALIYLRLYGGDDYRRNILIVCTLWLLDAVHLAMAFASAWFYLIHGWGNDSIHDYIPWTIALTVALTAVVTLISHCFFAHRVYVLSGCSWALTSPILLLAVGRLAAALVSTSEMITLHSYEAFVDQVGWVFTTGLSLSTTVDVLITVSLIVLLQRSRTGFSTVTDHLIDIVTLYTVETGLVTSITTAVSLVCWLTMPRNLIFLALHFSISKLYATSTLATLNARKSLRKRTRQPYPHLLPVLSSLHEAQSQTRRGDGDGDGDTDGGEAALNAPARAMGAGSPLHDNLKSGAAAQSTTMGGLSVLSLGLGMGMGMGFGRRNAASRSPSSGGENASPGAPRRFRAIARALTLSQPRTRTRTRTWGKHPFADADPGVDVDGDVERMAEAETETEGALGVRPPDVARLPV